MNKNQFPYLRQKYIYVLLLFILFLAGCLEGHKNNLVELKYDIESFPIMPLIASDEVAQLTTDEQSIVNYLVCSLFEQKKIEAQVKNKKYTYFIKVFGKNPPSNMLANLEDERVKIKPATSGRLRDDTVYDPDGNFAELYSIHDMIINGDTASVRVSFYFAPLSSISYKYHLVREQGSWKIIKTTDVWMS